MLQLKNMRPWEKVVKVIKVHWITYVILWIHILITTIVCGCVFYFLSFSPLSFLIAVILRLASLILFYIEWLNYELDMYVITDSRIISIEQISFLNRAVSECNLAQVQEVNSKTKWFFPNLLNYWNILIQTAWNLSNMSMKYCPDAMQEARQILNIVETYKEKRMKNVVDLEDSKLP